MAVGVFGHLAADESLYARDDDCYSTFYSLSGVLGQLVSANANDPRSGLWGMNDAGGPWLGSSSTGRRAEFQVAPDVGWGPALPLEAFTFTALASVARFGPLELHGLEYYVPMESVQPAPSEIETGRAWFATADTGTRTRLRITIDSGDSPAAPDNADDIVRAIERISPAEERTDVSIPHGLEHVDFSDPVPWRWWLGEGVPHLLTLQATATEWSGLGVGRVARLIVEACSSIGVVDPIGVRVVRETSAP
ncbi:hypothetical protein [Actinomycetospora soli]|uniref:hypothetical protein n=1 Tax=Actinomycetospora soli TaxID=2893887 RepID=UPI001E40381B|nr:hypothetical protein [Actinomycetospora soli]MCD2186612.1 hypothetical protein [Actinomycetospora soli]